MGGDGKLRRKQEILEVRNFPNECDICPMQFKDREALDSHFESRHQHNGFVCGTCMRCVLNEKAYLHGPGRCSKPGPKRQKEARKVKRDKKWAQLGHVKETAREDQLVSSNAESSGSKTYPQLAGTIQKNGYIVLQNRPCKIVEVTTSKTGKHGIAKCHFTARDIFTSKILEDVVPSVHKCDVPHVNHTEYQVFDISEDGYVNLFSENGVTKSGLRVISDDLLAQIKDDFAQRKDVFVSILSAMGEEIICEIRS